MFGVADANAVRRAFIVTASLGVSMFIFTLALRRRRR